MVEQQRRRDSQGLLAECGFDAHYRVTVGDNLERIVGVLGQACSRADVVVVSGGMGRPRTT